jgi:uncharacterized membrane protein YfcA
MMTLALAAILLGVALSSYLGKITQSKSERIAVVIILYLVLLAVAFVFRAFDRFI